MLILFDGEFGPRETLRFIEEKLGFGLFVWDVLSNTTQWSNGMFALLGLAPGSVEPNVEIIQSMTFPEDRWTPGALATSINEGLRLDREFRIVRRNGRVRWLATKAEVLMGADGKPGKVIGAVIDTTESHDFRARFELIEQRRQALVDAARGLAWIGEPDGKILDDPSLKAKRGENSGGSPGEEWLGWVHPDDRASSATAWRRAIEARKPYSVDHRMRQPDGTYRWTRSSATPVLKKDGTVLEWVGISYDIHQDFGGTGAAGDSTALSGEQIRGARGILNWAIRDLADASGVSAAVLRRLEEFDGISGRQDDPIDAIKAAFEDAGIEFLNMPDGKNAIRRSKNLNLKHKIA
jgi:PAS domain-containing protein